LVNEFILIRFLADRTARLGDVPHYVHRLTGGDPPVVQEPLG